MRGVQVAGNGTGPDLSGKYTISANSIRASFVPYGASITNLFINDSLGIERDVIVGYDRASSYYSTKDSNNFHLGGITGPYANVVANGTFKMDGMQYFTPINDVNATLNAGPDGWDSRNWTIVAHTTDSITFSIVDKNGTDSFPGDVIAYATYTVVDVPHPRWLVRIVAVSMTQTAPLMLASRAHWNLDGFQNGETPTILNHTLSLPFSGQRINVDPFLIPDGTISPNTLYSTNDFWSSTNKQIGANLTSTHLHDNCGANCTGYNNCYLISRDAGSQSNWWMDKGPVATLRSRWSNIRLNVYTDQSALQLTTCNNMDGSLPLKQSQGLHNRTRSVEKYGCVGLEFQDWIDGINHPEWGRQPKQQFGPGDAPFVLQAAYEIYASTPTSHCATETSFFRAAETAKPIMKP